MKIVIAIGSNLPGAGKSTIAKALSEEFKLFYFSSGNLIRDLFNYFGFSYKGKDFARDQDYLKQFDIMKSKLFIKDWFKKRGVDLNIPSGRNLDEIIDKISLKIAKRGNCVIDGWLSLYTINPSKKYGNIPYVNLEKGYRVIKILVKVTLTNSAKRLMKREKYKSISEAKKYLLMRFNKVRNRILEAYDFDIKLEKVDYDLIVNSDKFTESRMKKYVIEQVKKRLNF